MFSQVINYLKDPLLVANIQEFFGVDTHKNAILTKEKIKNEEYTSRKVIKPNGCTSYASITNGCTSNNNFTSQSVPDSLSDEGENSHAKVNNTTKLPVNNYFWYYLFVFSTQLGDEIFYSTFIPFWFWNIDAAVGRRTILVWAIVMTTGQVLKDIIRWPRPACPPAVRLQNKWSQEYGMPSTHAGVAVSIPFSVVLFTMDKYIYSVPFAYAFVVIWCSTICLSRLYLGMHTVLDIIAGLLLAFALMIPVVPLVDFMDYYLITNHWALGILIAFGIAVIVYYPCSDKWTPTRGDTTMVVALTCGVHFGTWINYKTGAMLPLLYPPPYSIAWPTYSIIGYIILRTIIGFTCIIPNKILCKTLTYKIICAIIQVDPKELMNSENSLDNKNKTIVNLIYNFTFCFTFGLHIICSMPRIFSYLGIDRSNFFAEM